MSETEGPSGEAEEDAAWQRIVANFGERVELEPDDLAEASMPGPYFGDDVDEPFEPDPEVYDEEPFVPPEPPPLPRSSPDRMLAWLALLGAPVVAVALFVVHASAGLYVPGWAVDLLVIAFLGGFGYLVLHMSREPRDPGDDGARL